MTTLTARSNQQFPNLGPASCDFHGREGVRCTPMDCEYYRVAPKRVTSVVPRHLKITEPTIHMQPHVETSPQPKTRPKPSRQIDPHAPKLPVQRKKRR